MSDPFKDDPELAGLVGGPKKPTGQTTSMADLLGEDSPPPSSASIAAALADSPVSISVPVEKVVEPQVTTTVKSTPPTPEAQLTPEQRQIRELQNQLAVANSRNLDAAEPEMVVATSDNRVLIHFLEDGLTALGQVWHKGQELEFDLGGQAFEDTKDRYGYSWLSMDESDQLNRYGKIYFRRGPWPGKAYQDPQAAEAEAKRRRAAPRMPVVPVAKQVV